MSNLSTMYEFIYDLNGTYYVIGMNECRKCEDPSLIEKYQTYAGLIQKDEFKNKVPEMFKGFRDKVADIYKEIKLECNVPFESREMTKEKVDLRARLEQEFDCKISDQINNWLKADSCLMDKEIEELSAKRKKQLLESIDVINQYNSLQAVTSTEIWDWPQPFFVIWL